MGLGKGERVNSTITVTSFNGFAGTVSFLVSFSPSVKHPPSFSMSPSSVAVMAGGFNTTTSIVAVQSNTDKLTYRVTVTARGGGISAMLSMPVTVVLEGR